MPTDDQKKYGDEIADAVARAMEHGLTATDVREEVDYAIETFEEDRDAGQ